MLDKKHTGIIISLNSKSPDFRLAIRMAHYQT